MALARRVGARILSGERVFVGSRLAYAVGNLLIYGPLRDVLGMSRIRVAYTAGDAIAPDLLMYVRSLGINLKQLYGSTETGFLVAMQHDGEVKPDTVGRAAEGVELRFTPEREILVRSPGLFKEYHGDPETTTRAKNAEGWFHTGDAGYLGEDGHLRLIDRMKYVGALKDNTPFAPKPIENKLKLFPYIKEALAFGAGRDTVCALIDMDMAAVGAWADRREISYTGHADLASRDETYGLISECIAKVNAELACDPLLAKSQIHRFVILPRELSADDGTLTHTGKLRRDAIAERYRSLVDAIYQGRLEAHLDGGGGRDDAHAAPAGLKIGDAKVHARAQASKAA
jgi:long-chain acyl-CoA synthetase